jgi:hypothetical protein
MGRTTESDTGAILFRLIIELLVYMKTVRKDQFSGSLMIESFEKKGYLKSSFVAM